MLRTDLITIDPEITGGTPVFTGTRVAIQTLFDYVATGETINDFLEGFPSVGRAQAEGVLYLAAKALIPDHLHVKPAQIDFEAIIKAHEAAA
ncbi:DUF433 domain-containing protein [Hymenobacter caeli]|uniref:Uncharacterized protein (DUF433 family) n=1 Tax=Hymenobacter caeli TaxID=2735894 RepID=A0ABX2FU51_9BACT|nr:DUF433 domain-containing protein [Hymenobacter caeli]NRT20723.1 uncharacterized protein (DUF433 family) [Hymenobacter caeli]